MTGEHKGADRRLPQAGDIVLFGSYTDGRGDVSEIPAIILGVQVPVNPDSAVDLKTFEMGREMQAHRDVRHAEGPQQGHWRWRSDR